MAAKEHKDRKDDLFTQIIWRLLVLICGCVFLGARANAEDLIALDGKVFTNAVLVTNYPSIVVIQHSGGRSGVKITNLPEGFCAKHGLRAPKTNPAPTAVFSQTNSVDQIVAQTEVSDLFEMESVYLTTNSWKGVTWRGGIERTWRIWLRGDEVSLDSDTTLNETNRFSKSMCFSLGQEESVAQAFYKFIEWDGIATTNKAEPFEKEITSLPERKRFSGYSTYSTRSFIFKWEKWSGAGRGEAQLVASGGAYDREDIARFRELIKRLPMLKEKLADRIRKKKEQKNLFK